MKLRLSKCLKWLVTIALIVLLVTVVDIRATWQTLSSARPWLLIGALALALFDRVVMLGKWLPLLRVQVPTVSSIRAAKVYLAASFAAVFLPASVGGDILRAYGLRGEHSEGAIRAGASIVMERLLGIFGLCLLIACVVAFQANQDPRLHPLIFVALGIGLLAVALIAIPGLFSLFWDAWGSAAGKLHASRWLGLLGRFIKAYGMYRGHKCVLVAVGILSFCEQLLPVVVIWTIAKALGVGIHFTMALVVVPITLLLARLPISISGFGVGEGLMVYLFGFFGIAPSAALAVGICGQAIGLASRLPGIVFWSEFVRRPSQATADPQIASRGPSSHQHLESYSEE